MPIRWESKILLAELEETYATDPVPTGAANAILATGIVLQPMEGQDVSRELELPWLAAQATIPAGLYTRLSFRVELVPSGSTGVAPAWGPLLVAGGCAEVVTPDDDPGDGTVVYNPVSDDHASATIHLWVGPTRYVLRGTRGSCVLRFNAQGVAYLEFSFTGLFAKPTDEARPTPSLAAFLKPDLVTSANTPTFEIAETALVMRNCSLDLGNDVQTRLLVGAENVIIVDRADAIACQVEATALATFDPFAMALDQEPVPVELVHGTVAGRIATLSVPGAQMQRPAGLASEQNVKEWPLRLTPLPVTGNDQWTLTLT